LFYFRTKLEIRAKQYLLGSKRVGARGRGWGEREGAGESLYAHMNKGNKKKKEFVSSLLSCSLLCCSLVFLIYGFNRTSGNEKFYSL
jgi:hypothetical protein